MTVPRFSFGFLIVLFLMLLAGVPSGTNGAVPVESPELKALLVRKEVKLETVHTEKNDSVVSFTLQRSDLTTIPPRVLLPFWIVAPPGGTATVRIQNAEWYVLAGSGKLDGPFKLGEQTSWGTMAPIQTTVRVLPQDDFRTVSLQRAEFFVASNITRTLDGKNDSGTAIITKATLSITIQAAPGDAATPLDLSKDDPYLQSLLNLLVVNKEQIGLCAREPKPLPNEDSIRTWNDMLTAAEKRGPILLSKLPRGGVYALRSSMLRDAGVAPETMPVSRIRVFAGKDELPLIEADVANDLLIGNASLIFYVPIDVTDKKPYTALWVMMAGEGEKPRRITLEKVPEVVTPPQEISGTVMTRIFQPNIFSHEQPITAPMLKWSTAEIPPTGFENYEFEVSHIHANTQAKFNAWIVGADPQRINASLFDLLINNKPVAAGEARTGRVENKAVSFESSQLVEGINTLSVSNPEQTDASKSNPFRFIMAEFTLPITSLGLKPQTLFTADFDAPTTYSVLLAKQDNFRGGGYAFDVTKPLEPLVINLAGQTNPLQYTAFLRVPAAGTQFLYAPAETYFVPSPFQAVKAPRSYADASQIDYLAIYYPELFNELRPLLDYRAKSMAVASYSVDDVYAAFSYGEISYQAIHDCIAHIFRARKAPRLREVLLVGEGSEYWWEYRRDSPGVSRNMIPVFGWQDPSVRIRGDESYALITGMGPIADVEIARISVNDPEEMKIVTNKILGYDTNPPTGEWRNRHLFVTDDEPDFISVARAIVRKAFLPPHAVELLKLQDFPYEDYFRGIWRKRSAEFTDRVIEEMSRGALTVTYLGHGGPNLWSSERILHIRDIDRMTDSGRHPFLIAGSCDTGWVDYPVEPVRASLSEHFIRRKNGGMIGAFIPIDGTSSYEHDYLISAFYEHLCHDKITDFGTLCLLSKLDYYLDRNNPSVTNQYLLMGDPASNLPPMPAPLDAKVEPTRILSATGRVLKITGRTDGYDHASGRVVVTDTTNLPIAESRFIVRSGDINTTVGIPAYLAPGSYNVLVEASNDEAKKSQLASLPLAVQESKVTLSWDTTPDASTVIEAGKPLQIRFKVRNETDLEIPNAQIVIDDVEKRKELARFPVTVAVGDNTTPPLEKSFPAGVTTVRGRLIIPSEDKEQLGDVLGESQLVLRAQSDQVRYLDFPLDAVAVSRLPQNAGTQFTIPVYNMTNLALPKLEAVLKRINATESVPLGDPLIIESLKPTESRSLTFNTTSVYTDSKPTNFLLELYDLSGDRRRLLQLTPFTYSFKSGPDVAIVPGSFISESENIFAGRTVYLRFSVVNNGDEVARNVRGLAYLNEPWVEKNAVPTSLVWFPPDSVDELYPGEKHTFRLRWDPTNGSSTTPVVFAAVKVNGTPGDVNLENNTLRKEFDFLAAPNLALTKDQVFVSSKFLKPYERVTVRVPFTNNSTQDFVRDFRMSVYAVGQRATRDRIAMRRFLGLKAGESALMQFDWVVKPGQCTLSFSLNEDREYLEDTYDDNTMTITMPYIVGDGEFGTDTNVWDFSTFPDFGMMHGVVRAPDGSISVSARPDAMMQTMPFNSDYLIEGTLGDQAKSDNLWGNLGGHLYLTFSETGPPVKFRMPVPDPDTNWYDVYFQSVGDYEPEQMSGDFKYRFEDNKNWALETRPTVGRIYMGRYDVRDGYLDFEISGPDYPSLNDISSISMAPVAGIYESPIIQLAKPLNASLLVDQETPRTTRIEYSLRFGLRSGDGITWQDWRPLVAGDKIVSPAGTNVTQWRATLYGGKEGEPVLKSVRFELNDHDHKPGAEIAAEDGNK